MAEISLANEYLSLIRPAIDAAVNSALPTMAASLKEEIKETAEANVYSYHASFEAMETRRGVIGSAANLKETIGDYQIEIENITEMQNGEGNEVQVVEEGWSSYRQPYPRPFMEEALNAYVDSGKAEEDIVTQLRSSGFDVV